MKTKRILAISGLLLRVVALSWAGLRYRPIVTYSTKLGKSRLDFNVRWIHDFDVSNCVEGDGFNFTASLKF